MRPNQNVCPGNVRLDGRNVPRLGCSPMFCWVGLKAHPVGSHPSLDQVITNLVKMVKARDIRRPFCPSGHWLSEEVNIRADKVSLFIHHRNSNNVLGFVTIKGGRFFTPALKLDFFPPSAGHPALRPICSKRVEDSKDGPHRASAVHARR